MNKKIPVLTDDAVEKLQGAYDQWSKSPPSNINRPPTGFDDQDQQAPEEYLAVTQETMAAAEDCDTGFDSATCAVYRLIDGDLEAVDGLEITAYNLLSEEIAAGTLVLISRDKFGTWLVSTVYGECETAGTATATATSTGGDDDGQWWIGSPPSGGQSGGAWYSGEGP